MYNYDELDALALKAREQLKEQSQQNMYSDLIEEQEEIPALSQNPVENNEVDYDDLYSLASSKYEDNVQHPNIKLYDELLFPGGPSKLQIDTWKKDWEGYDIYVTEILNQTFIFRTLNRFEYKQLITLQNVDALQREEVICQTVTLWPENYTWKEMATTLAGIPSTYAEIIMEKSGFTKDYAIQVL